MAREVAKFGNATVIWNTDHVNPEERPKIVQRISDMVYHFVAENAVKEKAEKEKPSAATEGK